jgi:hypothetical protein
MADLKFSELPTVVAANLADEYPVVQGGVNVKILGSQILDLMRDNIVESFAGNPNGLVAGEQYQLLWDTTNVDLYICTTSGVAAVSVWTLIASSNFASFHWSNVTTTTQTMATNNGYISNNGSLVTLTLPEIVAVGARVAVVGNGAGGWKIAQRVNQIIHVGSSTTTTGTGGSIASTNRYDSVNLICTVANAEFVTEGGIQGIITVV